MVDGGSGFPVQGVGRRPFVLINAAMSADGKIATRERRQTRISGFSDFQRVDVLRAESDAVVVGIGTVLADNPSLTVKSPELREKRLREGRDENPIRVVVDSTARIPLDAEFLEKGPGKRIIAVSPRAPRHRLEALSRRAEIITTGSSRPDLSELFRVLWERGVRKILVEGGATLNWSLIQAGLVDEIHVYLGNMIIGGSTSPTLVDGEGFLEPRSLTLLGVERVDGGVLVKWRTGLT